MCAVLITSCSSPVAAPTPMPVATNAEPVNGTALVESVEIEMVGGSPLQVNAIVRGNLPDAGCTSIASVEQVRADSTFLLQFVTTTDPLALCAQVLTPFEQVIPLDVSGLATGSYSVAANGVETMFEITAQPVTDFTQQLLDALNARDFGLLKGMMGNSLLIAYWQSEGDLISQDNAIEQLQGNLLGSTSPIMTDATVDLETLLGTDPLRIVGPQGIEMRALFISGLGDAGTDEAILFIADRPSGEPFWYGILFAKDGF